MKKLDARTCEVRKITNEEANGFCNIYHSQKGIKAEACYGLFHNGELVQVETFGHPRIERQNNVINSEWELYRECSKSGYSIRGGVSKLLKAFEREYEPKVVLSYCNTTEGYDGHSYAACGFVLEQTTVDYWYEDENGSKFRRYQMQKNKNLRQKGKKEPIQITLESIGAEYDPELTEKENALRAGLVLRTGTGQQAWRKYYGENIGYVYEIENLDTGKTYIGKHNLMTGGKIGKRNYFGSGTLISEDVKRYGKRRFKIRPLYWTDDFEQLLYAELSFILKAKEEGKAEYNIKISLQNEGWRVDKKFAKEVQDRSNATQREQAALMTEEERKEHYGNFRGGHHTEESRARISASSKKLWQDEEYRRKRSEALKKYYENEGEVWNKGKTGIYSQEQLTKIGQAGKTKMDNIRAQLPEGWVLVSDFVRETGITRAKVLSHYEYQEMVISNCKLYITNKVEKEFIDGRGKWERKK